MTLAAPVLACTIILMALVRALSHSASVGGVAVTPYQSHSQSPTTPAAQPRQQDADPLVAAGRKVYEQQKCASCHQIASRGNSRFPLDGVGSKLTPAQLRRWMTDTAEMEAALPRLPAIRMSEMKIRLNARELDALVAYLASLK